MPKILCLNLVVFSLALVLFACSEVTYITGSKEARVTIEASATGVRTDLAGPFQYCSEPGGLSISICQEAVKVQP